MNKRQRKKNLKDYGRIVSNGAGYLTTKEEVKELMRRPGMIHSDFKEFNANLIQEAKERNLDE